MSRRKLRFFDRNSRVMVNLTPPKLDRLVLLKDNFTLMLITDITMVTGGPGIFDRYRCRTKAYCKTLLAQIVCVRVYVCARV